MTENSEVFALPQSWSIDEVCQAYGITRDTINALIRDGKVGYFHGRKRSRRFFAEHLQQIRAALEVKPQIDADVFSRIGVNPATATRLRNARRRTA